MYKISYLEKSVLPNKAEAIEQLAMSIFSDINSSFDTILAFNILFGWINKSRLKELTEFCKPLICFKQKLLAFNFALFYYVFFNFI